MSIWTKFKSVFQRNSAKTEDKSSNPTVLSPKAVPASGRAPKKEAKSSPKRK